MVVSFECTRSAGSLFFGECSWAEMFGSGAVVLYSIRRHRPPAPTNAARVLDSSPWQRPESAAFNSVSGRGRMSKPWHGQISIPRQTKRQHRSGDSPPPGDRRGIGRRAGTAVHHHPSSLTPLLVPRAAMASRMCPIRCRFHWKVLLLGFWVVVCWILSACGLLRALFPGFILFLWLFLSLLDSVHSAAIKSCPYGLLCHLPLVLVASSSFVRRAFISTLLYGDYVLRCYFFELYFTDFISKLAWRQLLHQFWLVSFCFWPGIEARGFIFGPAIALALGAKFIPLRKPRKLPGEVTWSSSVLG
jgi:hypothetical protein